MATGPLGADFKTIADLRQTTVQRLSGHAGRLCCFPPPPPPPKAAAARGLCCFAGIRDGLQRWLEVPGSGKRQAHHGPAEKSRRRLLV